MRLWRLASAPDKFLFHPEAMVGLFAALASAAEPGHIGRSIGVPVVSQWALLSCCAKMFEERMLVGRRLSAVRCRLGAAYTPFTLTVAVIP
jgi:hypothetical protein